MKRIVCSVLALMAALWLIGCGGATAPIEPGTTQTSRARLTINWAERSRNIGAPASALSAVIKLPGAREGGGDVTFTVNRGNNTSAFSETFESPDSTYVGRRRIEVTFYADASGNGSVVGTASATVDIRDDGVITDTITNVQNAVGVVEVAAGQSLIVGEQKFLTFTARRSSGEIVAVSPGSAFFTAVGGGDKLSVSGVVAQGLAGGTASVTATVDGVTSAPADVTVQPQVKIALVANGQNPQVIAFLQLLQARNVTPSRFDAIPDPNTLQQFDVLMVGGSGNVSSADAGKVEAFLNAGKGVVLLGNAPAVLAGDTDSRANLRPISSWFAGVTELRDAYSVIVARSNPGAFPLPASVSPGSVVYEPNDADQQYRIPFDAVQNPVADQVLLARGLHLNGSDGVAALAYELPSGGGRVYWQFHPYGLNRDYSNKILSMLLTGTSWTAKR